MPKKSIFFTNKDEILEGLKENYYNQHELIKYHQKCKDNKLIPNSMNLSTFLSNLNNYGFSAKSIYTDDVIKTLYSFEEDINIYDFTYNFSNKGFFSMTTALNIMKLSDKRDNFIFYSTELSKKNQYKNDIELKQDIVDEVFSKPYRKTKKYFKYEDKYIVQLSPKYSNNYEVIEYNGYNISSINRVFVELMVNIQYFKDENYLIEIIKPLKEKFNINKIYSIIEKFDYIYPYFQLAGYYLEKIGFDKGELMIFKNRVTPIKFYTQKMLENKKFNEYWNIYHY